jgi:hypothetical protein
MARKRHLLFSETNLQKTAGKENSYDRGDNTGVAK